MAGCISEIPMWKDSACLSTELHMSNDPSTREVSSAAQGIKMAQIVTGFSEKMSCGFLRISQAGWLAVEKKEHYSESEIQHWILSNAHYSSATLEHQPLHWCFIHPLVQALLQSRSASPMGHQQTQCLQLWFGYNSLRICCDAVYSVSLSNKHPQLNPSFNFWVLCFIGIWKSLCSRLWHGSSWSQP